MSFRVKEFESTPNPNAVKCWLDRPVSKGPRSFRTAEEAAGDPLAAALFREAGITNLLLCGDWLTVNKQPQDAWPKVKRQVQRVLEQAPGSAS